MRKFFLLSAATVLLLVGSFTAQAADLPRSVPLPPPAPAFVPAPAYNWSGFYVGGNIGAAWSQSTLAYNPTGASWGFNQSRFLGGGQVGFNYQINNVVLGVEGDMDWTNLGNTSAVVAGLQSYVGTPWVATLAGRFGVANANWLFYGKAGGGWVKNTASLYNAAGATVWSGSNTNSGWLLGAGIEYAFDRNWSAKIEYDYLGLRNWTANPALIAGDSLNVSRSIQEVKIGFNYKFDWGVPNSVMARY